MTRTSCGKCHSRVRSVVQASNTRPLAVDPERVLGGTVEMRAGIAHHVGPDPQVKRYRVHVCPPPAAPAKRRPLP